MEILFYCWPNKSLKNRIDEKKRKIEDRRRTHSPFASPSRRSPTKNAMLLRSIHSCLSFISFRFSPSCSCQPKPCRANLHPDSSASIEAEAATGKRFRKLPIYTGTCSWQRQKPFVRIAPDWRQEAMMSPSCMGAVYAKRSKIRQETNVILYVSNFSF